MHADDTIKTVDDLIPYIDNEINEATKLLKMSPCQELIDKRIAFCMIREILEKHKDIEL